MGRTGVDRRCAGGGGEGGKMTAARVIGLHFQRIGLPTSRAVRPFLRRGAPFTNYGQRQRLRNRNRGKKKRKAVFLRPSLDHSNATGWTRTGTRLRPFPISQIHASIAAGYGRDRRAAHPINFLRRRFAAAVSQRRASDGAARHDGTR